MNLQQKLDNWRQAGLLEPKQVEAILQYENNAAKNNFALYGFVGLGASVFILGIISIIAANWNEISSETKLTTYFILQFSLGIAYLKIPATRDLLKETFLYLFALSFLGGIGLISQIFQLSGAFWKPFAFWLLLSIGTVFAAQKRLLVHLWWIIFLVTFPFALKDMLVLNKFLELNLACLIVIFLIVALGLRGAHILLKLPVAFTELALKYGFSALLLLASFCGTELWYGRSVSINSSLIFATILMYLVAFLAYLSMENRLPLLNRNLKKAIICLFVTICLFNSLPIFSHYFYGKIGAASCFVVLWFCAAWVCALLPSKRLYNLATIIIMCRFIAIYIEVFGNLLNTGIGLIISGLALLCIALVWHRYRQVLLRWMQV